MGIWREFAGRERRKHWRHGGAAGPHPAFGQPSPEVETGGTSTRGGGGGLK